MKSGWEIGLIEDQARYRAAAVDVLSAIPEVGKISTWDSAEEFWRDPGRNQIELALIDIHLKHMNGISLAAMLNDEAPDLPIAMLTAIDDEATIFRALEAGAIGYILKADLARLGELVVQLMGGGAVMTPTIALRVMQSFRKKPPELGTPKLTARERQVLEQITAGLSIQKAAERLGVSWNTLNTHLKSIYRKLNVTNRIELVQEAERIRF